MKKTYSQRLTTVLRESELPSTRFYSMPEPDNAQIADRLVQTGIYRESVKCMG